jgi:hypothetical protein
MPSIFSSYDTISIESTLDVRLNCEMVEFNRQKIVFTKFFKALRRKKAEAKEK